MGTLTIVPAKFAVDLCKYRASNGKPNTSDSSDKASVDLGIALFDALGVAPDATGGDPTGSPLAREVAADLAASVAVTGSEVAVETERHLNTFQQYRHVGAIADLTAAPSREYTVAWRRLRAEVGKRITTPASAVTRLQGLLGAVEDAVDQEIEIRRKVLAEVGSESLLRLDVTVADTQEGRLPDLLVGLSLKWSLRTDRAQDCRSQGAKLAALRRGRMPHFATVTMEPRPYMLNLLGGGSGDVDCVYHLDLPALIQAVEAVYGNRTDKASRKTYDTFKRLVDQRRVRDYDELVGFVQSS